jgi:hypothetical protein
MRVNVHMATAGLVLAVSVMSVSADMNPRFNPGGGVDLDLYQTADNTPTGPHAYVGPVVDMPVFLDPGYLVLLEHGNPSNPIDYGNMLNWANVVQFGDTTVQLFSATNGAVAPWFPDLATVLAEPHLFILENQTGTPTWYPAGLNNYYIWTTPPRVIVPEPSQVASGLLVLAGATGYAVRRRRQSRT